MTDIIFISLAFLLSAVVSWFIIPRVILISFKKKLFDSQGGRKVHKGSVPRLGGVAFTPAIVISISLVIAFSYLFNKEIPGTEGTAIQMTLLFVALLLIYFSGVTDDLMGLGYKFKFLVQFTSAGIVVGAGICIGKFYGLFGIENLPYCAGCIFSIMLIVYIINALNLIDGIDGLASGLSMVALLFFGVLFKACGDTIYAVISFSTLGALVPFFFYNVFGSETRKSKIFMGDCGSLVLGLIIGVLATRFSMREDILPFGETESLIAASSVIIIPCFDVVRVMFARIIRGTNPFLPDKTHIHHKFLAIGMGQTTTLVVLLMLDICCILLNLMAIGNIDINIIFATNVAVYILLNTWLSFLIKKRETTGVSA